MKIKTGFKLLVCIFLIGIIPVKTNAQVTIGDTKEPLPVSVLELISVSGNQSGLRLPQLSTDEITILTGEINKLGDKSKAKGMMVFNMTTNCVEVWNGTEFKGLCGDLGQAQFTIGCDDLTVYPIQDNALDPTGEVYREGSPLTTSHYILLPVNCTRAGSYLITIDTKNGYSFVASGTLLDTGDYVIKLAGQGIPVTGSDAIPQVNYKDDLYLAINDEEIDVCDQAWEDKITVYPEVVAANFTANCNTGVTVNGYYAPGQVLNSSHSITLNLTGVTKGLYSFRAEGYGLVFAASGLVTPDGSGNATITLQGSGTVDANAIGPQTLTVKNMLTNTNVCADVPIVFAYPPMRILSVGYIIYSPGSSSAPLSTGLIESGYNFAPSTTATVPMQGFILDWENYSITAANLQQYLTGTGGKTRPDVLLLTWDFRPTTTTSGYINTFLETGGIVIACTQYDTDAGYLNTAVFGQTVTATQRACYSFPFVGTDIPTDDPILYGPFAPAGGLVGKYWGEDANNASHLNGIPTGAIVYSYHPTSTVSAPRPVMLRHPTKSFLWCGDGGPFAGDTTNSAYDIYPFKVNNTTEYRPATKTYYGGTSTATGSRVEVYNSHFFGNALYWTILEYNKKKNP